ncbi:MAG: sulfatase-like hydrolase/transferase [Alphaproteobacteria bacterium]|nr:sulfatase-like hydrolase/transferase [Alphaproteobacteria bacterium]
MWWAVSTFIGCFGNSPPATPDAEPAKGLAAATGTPAADGAAPDVLILVLDTVRADVLPPSADTGLTPHLEARAAGFRRFSNALAPATWTAPAVASILTGAPTWRHRVAGATWNIRPVPTTTPDLVRRLEQEAGYGTWLYTANGLINQLGLPWSAAEVRGYHHQGQCCGDAPVLRQLTEQLPRQLQPERPDLVVVDLMEAHSPALWREDCIDDVPDGARSWFEDGPPADSAWLQRAVVPVSRATPERPAGFYLPAEGALDVEVGSYAADVYRGLYRCAIRRLDGEVDTVLTAWDAADHPDGQLTFVLSDHGELLGEHGHLGHGGAPVAELVRVPLWVGGRGVVPGIVDAPVQTHDVAATVLRHAGLDPGEAVGGDLLGELPDTRVRGAKSWWPTADELLVTDVARMRRVEGPPTEPLLFDDRADPMWTRPIDDPAAAAAADAAADEFFGAHSPILNPSVAEVEGVEELEALGYLEPAGK